MTDLALEHVTKVFGDPDVDGVVAVEDISFAVDDGDFLVLLGPSGCGKTTTLRMIAGLEEVSDGRVLFDGNDVTGMKARHRDVAMVFQDFALYPHMDVRGNLGFGLKREENNLSEAAIEERIEDVAHMLEIEDHLDKSPGELSGGQKQRVALGRAIIREPRLFLFDEPLANLDASLRKTMRTEIDELQAETGITSVYVTHNQEEAMSVADEIAIMRRGRLQQLGPPSTVFNEPRNLFVAQFVGSPRMNLFAGSLTAKAESYQIRTDSFDVELASALVEADKSVENVLVGFRPQDLSKLTEPEPEGPVIESALRVIEPLGTEAVLYGDTADEEIRAITNRFHNLSIGETVSLTIKPEYIYLFDAESEELMKGRLDVERADAGPAGEAEA